MKLRFFSGLVAFLLCSLPGHAAENELSAAEKLPAAAALRWKKFRWLARLPAQSLPAEGWEIKDGTIHVVPKMKGGELITEKKFADFEFSWSWRYSRAQQRNQVFVTEDPAECSRPDTRCSTTRSIPTARMADPQTRLTTTCSRPRRQTLPQAREWNHLTRRRERNQSSLLNGKNVLAYEIGSDR